MEPFDALRLHQTGRNRKKSRRTQEEIAKEINEKVNEKLKQVRSKQFIIWIYKLKFDRNEVEK